MNKVFWLLCLYFISCNKENHSDLSELPVINHKLKNIYIIEKGSNKVDTTSIGKYYYTNNQLDSIFYDKELSSISFVYDNKNKLIESYNYSLVKINSIYRSYKSNMVKYFYDNNKRLVKIHSFYTDGTPSQYYYEYIYNMEGKLDKEILKGKDYDISIQYEWEKLNVKSKTAIKNNKIFWKHEYTYSNLFNPDWTSFNTKPWTSLNHINSSKYSMFNENEALVSTENFSYYNIGNNNNFVTKETTNQMEKIFIYE